MITCIDLKTVSFHDALTLQEELRIQRRMGSINDTLLFCEHPRIFTMGRQDCTADWKVTAEQVKAAGIDIVATNRGGRITYHGPGQLVGYFVFDINQRNLGVKELVNTIEEGLIRTVKDFGVTAARDSINPGIWVGNAKLGAIGLHISQGVTQHGFALNYQTQLDDYRYIVPCGLAEHGVTSLKKLMGNKAPTRRDIIDSCINKFAELFSDEIEWNKNYTSAAVKVGPASATATSSAASASLLSEGSS